ncbi:MAG: nucleotidyltransferase domain-containing protein [Gammaproteobacteria bacterium]|nr:nucleotidyltransferase domain-containing protein [Gammaproteobacteria bacterium]
MQSTSLGDALFTRTQQKVLGLLYGRPQQTFYLNEIVRLANVGKGTIKRELTRMVSAGLLTVTPIGNQNHYQANADCPVYPEILGLVRKTFGMTDVLRDALLLVWEQIELAFIYGSIASGTETAGSDIDVMLITETLAYADVMTALEGAEVSLGRSIHPTIYTRQQFNDKLQAGNAFVTRVMEQPRLWIKGEDNVTGDIGQSGQD